MKGWTSKAKTPARLWGGMKNGRSGREWIPPNPYVKREGVKTDLPFPARPARCLDPTPGAASSYRRLSFLAYTISCMWHSIPEALSVGSLGQVNSKDNDSDTIQRRATMIGKMEPVYTGGA